MDGVIIDNKVYKLVPKENHSCSECDLYSQCNKFEKFCNRRLEYVMFRYSKELTEKITSFYFIYKIKYYILWIINQFKSTLK